MEEEKRLKRARAGDWGTDESPRKGKAPRIEPPPADSGCGCAAVLQESDSREDPGVWVAVAIRDTDGGECGHMMCDMDEIASMGSTIANATEDAPMCEDGTCLTTGRHLMMVCSECDLYLCIGGPPNKAKPRGHIREHAFRKAHCVALRYEDPCEGYCFECEDSLSVEMGMVVNGDEGCHASGFANGHGCVIRGIPNLGNTCYLNALLQCLLVLGKLRARMSGPDAPSGVLGGILHDLFVDTNSVSYTRGLLDPTALLTCVRLRNPLFKGTFMQDSHELLCCLRDSLNKEEKVRTPGNMQQGAPSDMAPTVIDSIFGGQLCVTMSCKCCSFKSVSHDVFYDLSVPLPPKGAPAKSVASPPQNERCISQGKIHTELFSAIDKTNTQKIHMISEGDDPQVPFSESEDMVMVKTSEPLKVDSDKLEQILQSKDDVHDPLQTPIRKENMLIVSSGDVEKTNSAVVDNAFNGPEASIEAKMDTFYGEVDTQDKGKARNLDEVEDINSLGSIEKCMELHFKAETIGWTCENCSKVAQKASTISGKDGEQIMASTIANGTIDGDQVEQSDRNSCQSELSNDLIRLAVECTSSSMQSHGNDAHHQVMPAVDIKIEGDTPGMSCDEKDWSSCSIANKKPECLEGAQEDVLLYGQYQNASIQDVRKGKQVNLAHSAHQVEENQYDRQDRNVHAIQTLLITKLPPVLAIHLNRCLGPLKVSGHVCFEEILDVGQFMHPSSEEKDNSRYRLVGVVEHQGLGTDIGHFVAYVRPSNQHHSSGSSSWFCASDININEISLDEVLKCEAYLLFYERMES